MDQTLSPYERAAYLAGWRRTKSGQWDRAGEWGNIITSPHRRAEDLCEHEGLLPLYYEDEFRERGPDPFRLDDGLD